MARSGEGQRQVDAGAAQLLGVDHLRETGRGNAGQNGQQRQHHHGFDKREAATLLDHDLASLPG
ncbi:hypothetical protein D3C78_504080 [compost metagenome]